MLRFLLRHGFDVRRPRGWALIFVLSCAARLGATDIEGVMNAALDQPRINVAVRRSPQGPPLATTSPFFGDEIFNVQAFYDSGASGVLLSEDTADGLGVLRATFENQQVIFEDVGVGGSTEFGVSEALYFSLGNFHPDTNTEDISRIDLFYPQTFGPIVAQVGPLDSPSSLLGSVDVFGMPVIDTKVIVMDPRPVNEFALSGDLFDIDTMRTYVYDVGTAYNPASADTDPGIVPTTRTVRLSRGDFERFTRTSPDGAKGPDLITNPFIGRDPSGSASLAEDADPPPIKLTLGDRSSEGSWLFDMGAVATIISTTQAENLGVRYSTDPQHALGSDDPVLEGVSQQEQFTLSIGGIGGTVKAAGFAPDTLLMRTAQGNPTDDDDPAHLRFVKPPVLVADITVADPNSKDPENPDTVTLDGIFGMNLVIGSTFFDEGNPLGFLDNVAPGAFDWVVFDTLTNTLGFVLNWDFFGLPGDVNGDGSVNNLDVTAFIHALGTGGGGRIDDPASELAFQTLTGGGTFRAADINLDLFVNNSDISPFIGILATTTVTGQTTERSLPEPSILGLISMGAAVLLLRRPPVTGGTLHLVEGHPSTSHPTPS